MSRQAFEKKLEAVRCLRTAAELRKPLQDRNNYLVSKAAESAAALRLEELIPDLIAAFDRFLTDPVKSDPQCWAKHAIAKALHELGHRDAPVFVKGIGHIQPEPVWGGSKDSAGPLRSACALALVDCRVDVLQILIHLTDLLADAEASVRNDAARAIGVLGSPEGALPLRLKALLGDDEPSVIGQCLASLSAIAPADALVFIPRFLDSPDENTQAEAASVLAQSRDAAALHIVKQFLARRMSFEVRRSVLLSLGASPLRESADLLLSMLPSEMADSAAAAVAALAASRFRAEIRDDVKAALEARDDEKLLDAFRREFA
jgi:HEAT repeat protein